MVLTVRNTSDHPVDEVAKLVNFAINRSGVHVDDVLVYGARTPAKRSVASVAESDGTFSIEVCPGPRYEWEDADWRESLVSLLAGRCRHVRDWPDLAGDAECERAGAEMVRHYRAMVASEREARANLGGKR